jgi:hypothetical protein
MSKSIKISNVTFVLRDRRLYASGIGYYSTTKDDTKVRVDLQNEIQVDLCIKDIDQSSLPNYLAVYDTRDLSYDVCVHDDILSQTHSFVQNRCVMLIGTLFLTCAYYLLTHNKIFG